jgi:hypothetical protein
MLLCASSVEPESVSRFPPARFYLDLASLFIDSSVDSDSLLQSLEKCPVCDSPKSSKRRFCSRACLKKGYGLGLVKNAGLFKRGSISLNKGKTLESWVGEERAREIRARMSANSLAKAPQLRRLNEDPGIVARRIQSRKSHDIVVKWLADKLRERGCRVFTLSEYIKEKRIPDAIVFDGKNLIALEVETEKRWKPSHASTEDRLSRLNSLCRFFDKTKVVFPSAGGPIDNTESAYLKHILS